MTKGLFFIWCYHYFVHGKLGVIDKIHMIHREDVLKWSQNHLKIDWTIFSISSVLFVKLIKVEFSKYLYSHSVGFFFFFKKKNYSHFCIHIMGIEQRIIVAWNYMKVEFLYRVKTSRQINKKATKML